MSNSQTIAASEARNNFSDLISKVQYQGNTFLIERYGEIVAKVVPVEVTEKQVEVKEKVEEKPRQVVQTEQKVISTQQEAVIQKTEPQLTQEKVEENKESIQAKTQEEQPKPQDTVMSESVVRALQRLSELTKSRRSAVTTNDQPNQVVSQSNQEEDKPEIIRKRIEL